MKRWKCAVVQNGCTGSEMNNVIVLDSLIIQQLNPGKVNTNHNLAQEAKIFHIAIIPICITFLARKCKQIQTRAQTLIESKQHSLWKWGKQTQLSIKIMHCRIPSQLQQFCPFISVTGRQRAPSRPPTTHRDVYEFCPCSTSPFPPTPFPKPLAFSDTTNTKYMSQREWQSPNASLLKGPS